MTINDEPFHRLHRLAEALRLDLRLGAPPLTDVAPGEQVAVHFDRNATLGQLVVLTLALADCVLELRDAAS